MTKPLLPPNLKLRRAESDLLSNSSYSSRSSIPSINDNASVSSLDLSFDGAGNPTFNKKNTKTSAFAKVRGGTENYDSVSEDEDSGSDVGKARSNNASPVRMGTKKKSSFFRLKNIEDSDEG